MSRKYSEMFQKSKNRGNQRNYQIKWQDNTSSNTYKKKQCLLKDTNMNFGNKTIKNLTLILLGKAKLNMDSPLELKDMSSEFVAQASPNRSRITQLDLLESKCTDSSIVIDPPTVFKDIYEEDLKLKNNQFMTCISQSQSFSKIWEEIKNKIIILICKTLRNMKN